MRLWTLHPKYLDRRGLLALWREGLLAQAVLSGKTRGYRHHPQLERFREARDPLAAIGAFLKAVHSEAASRGYSFDYSKILKPNDRARLKASKGQLEYEARHLRKKLKVRDPKCFRLMSLAGKIIPNPVFVVYPGGIEEWERAK